MRLLLFLVAALSVGLSADTIRNRPETVSKYTMARGFPDGTILTFFFWHTGNENVTDEREPVKINFYDLPDIPIDQVYDIKAHLRIDRNRGNHPVESNSYIDYEWKTPSNPEMPQDETPPRDGWWRVDVYKHDQYNLNVFFQGYWAGVREFYPSLDDIRSIYVISQFVDHDNVQVRIKYANSYFPPMSVAETYTFLNDDPKPDRVLISFPYFPLGSHIEMVAVLRASGGMKEGTPSFLFQNDGKPCFMSIQQNMYNGTEELWITHTSHKRSGTKCLGDEKAHGDLLHIRIERIGNDKISLQNFYAPATGVEGAYCEHILEAEYVRLLDEPFNITSHQGAMILHLDHSVPRSVEVQSDCDTK